MVPTVCHQCGTAVAEDEQFCPSCGTFIDPVTSSRSGGEVISVSSDGPYEEFELGSAPPAEEVPASPRADGDTPTASCPSCGAQNPPNNRHCQECGARLSQAPLPTAPRPAVQASAGVRAAMAISALLFTVIVVALLFNVFFGGDETASGTTVPTQATTQPTIAELGPIEVLSTECNPDGIGSFVCDNLTSGTADEYQFTWEDRAEGDTATIRLTFRQPMVVQRIDWRNLEDPTRFKQNYRARGIIIDAQNSLQPYPRELLDTPGTQNINFAAVNANWIEFQIESAYTAEVTEGNVFREMAIDEITIIGRPANADDS